MSVSLNKEELNLSKFIARDSFTAWIEQEVLVPDIKPDVMKIIKVEAIPYIEETNISDGTIKVSGRINYYILYRSMENGGLRGITVEYPFAQTINTSLVKTGMYVDIEAIARNIIYSLPNERKIMLKTEIVFKYTITDMTKIPVPITINDGDNIEFKVGQDVFNNVIDIKRESLDINEEIVLPEDIGTIDEIVKVSARITNTDYKISYNKILVKGDLDLQILYIKSDENAMIGTYKTTVPFAGMVEFDNISDSYKFNIKYCLQNLEITLNGTDNNMISVNGALMVRTIMYEEKDISHISDFYSTNKNLVYDHEDVAVIKNKSEIQKEIQIRERIGEVEDGNRIIDYQVDTNSLNFSVSGGNLYLNGSIKVPVIFQNINSGAVDSKTYEIVTENTIPLGRDIPQDNVSIDIDVDKKDVSIVGNNVEANITLKVTIGMENIDNITMINDINEQDINESDFDSMYIYIVKKGDTLWDIAKKYKTTVSKIANVNNINDESKIEIGQKILLIR